MTSNVRTLPDHARKHAAYSVRRAREEAGLTQEQAAQRRGMSTRGYAAMERGEVPMRALEAYLDFVELAAQRAGRKAA